MPIPFRANLGSTVNGAAGPELRHLRITFNGRGLLRGRGHVSRSSDEGKSYRNQKQSRERDCPLCDIWHHQSPQHVAQDHLELEESMPLRSGKYCAICHTRYHFGRLGNGSLEARGRSEWAARLMSA